MQRPSASRSGRVWANIQLVNNAARTVQARAYLKESHIHVSGGRTEALFGSINKNAALGGIYAELQCRPRPPLHARAREQPAITYSITDITNEIRVDRCRAILIMVRGPKGGRFFGRA